LYENASAFIYPFREYTGGSIQGGGKEAGRAGQRDENSNAKPSKLQSFKFYGKFFNAKYAINAKFLIIKKSYPKKVAFLFL
jgi:hypothetical protein